MWIGTVKNFHPVLNPLHCKADLALAAEHIRPDTKGLGLTSGHTQFTDSGYKLKDHAGYFVPNSCEFLQVFFSCHTGPGCSNATTGNQKQCDHGKLGAVIEKEKEVENAKHTTEYGCDDNIGKDIVNGLNPHGTRSQFT